MSTDVALREIDPADTTAAGEFFAVSRAGFLEARPDERARRAYGERVAGHRLLSAQAGGRVVGTFRSFASEVTLPGAGPVPVNAVSTVTVLPTHRRRGVLSRMMADDLARAREREHAFSALIAMEAPIYGRFGFGAATRSTRWVVDADRAAFRPDAPGGPAGGGSLEVLDPADAREDCAAVHDAARRARPGGLERPARWWAERTAAEGPGALGAGARVVLHRDADGVADGYACYEITESWAGRVSRSSATVSDLSATSPAAYRDLWEFVTSIDLVRSVSAPDRPVDELLPHLLTDPRAAQDGPVDDFLWLRVLDVPGALAARRYLGSGTLVLRVLDPTGLADATVRLHVGADRCAGDGWTCAEVTTTDAEPDVRLGVGDLGSLLLGGTSPVALRAAGRLQASAADAHRLQALLATPESPWCPTWF